MISTFSSISLNTFAWVFDLLTCTIILYFHVEKLNENHGDRIRFFLSKADTAGHESDRQVCTAISMCFTKKVIEIFVVKNRGPVLLGIKEIS